MYWLAPLALLVAGVLALKALPGGLNSPENFKIPIRRPRHPTLVLLALLLAATGFYLRYHFPDPDKVNWFWKFVYDLAPEMVGMAFTILVIDALTQKRLEQQEKERLFAQVKSPVRDMAVEALRLIRENDWFDEMVKKYRGKLNVSFQWQGANLQWANLTELTLLEVHLTGANLKGANLQHVRLFRADLENANLERANMQRADLQQANMQRANLSGVNLEKALLPEANLQEINLRDANLYGAYLAYANIQGAYLKAANLQKADLTLTNMRGANLEMVNLEGATYSEETIWPENFDPQKAGAIKVRLDYKSGQWIPDDN